MRLLHLYDEGDETADITYGVSEQLQIYLLSRVQGDIISHYLSGTGDANQRG